MHDERFPSKRGPHRLRSSGQLYPPLREKDHRSPWRIRVRGVFLCLRWYS